MHLKREILRRIRFGIIKNYLVFVNFSKILIIVFKLICMRSSGVITGSVKILLSSKQGITFLNTLCFRQLLLNKKSSSTIGNSSCFTKIIVKFIGPSPSSFFNGHNSQRTKFIRRLQLGLSHQQVRKSKHSFHYLLSPISNCETDVKLTLNYFLHSLTCNTKRHTLIRSIRNTSKNLLGLPKRFYSTF